MNQLKKLWARLLQRFDSVDDLLSGFDKYQRKLQDMSERLRAKAVEQEAEAERLKQEATAKSDEAERAIAVADKFRDLLSK